MNKIGIALAVSIAGLCSSPVSADTLLGGYVGANVWNMQVNGGFSNDSLVTDFAFEDETTSSFYIALEHPIPIIPNIKLVRTEMDTSGVVALTSEFRFEGELFTQDSNLSTDIELSTTDIILYYEILDNDLVSFDLGLNGKLLDGNFAVSEIDGVRTAASDYSVVVPMVYSKLEVGIPATGISAYIEGSYLSLDDNTLSDFQAAIAYSFIESLALDISVEAGYRETSLELEDVDDIYTDLTFSGVYVGLEFDF